MCIRGIQVNPFQCKFEVDYLDALYKISKSCIFPGGWSCESLPYIYSSVWKLRESGMLKVADTTSHFVWGRDEISWFAQQDKKTEITGWNMHATEFEKPFQTSLQMPLSWMILVSNETAGSYRAILKMKLVRLIMDRKKRLSCFGISLLKSEGY